MVNDVGYPGQVHQVVCEAALLSRQEVFDIIHWLIGKVGNYTQCLRCGTSVSREHTLVCGGARVELWRLCRRLSINPTIDEARLLSTLLDKILKVLNRGKDMLVDVYKDISRMLLQCKERTMGWQRFVIDEYADDEDVNEALNIRLKRKKDTYKSRKRKRPHRMH